MKIVYLLNDINSKGGVNRIAFDKINYLINYYSISIIYFGHKNDIPFYDVDGRIQFYNISVNPFVSSFSKKVKSIYKVYQSYKRLIGLLKPDIIVNMNTNILSWIVPFFNRDIPKLIELHQSYDGVRIFNDNNYGKGSLRGHFSLLLRRIIYPLYDRIVVLTNKDKQQWRFKNIIVISNYTNIKNNDTINIERKNFIWVGRLSHQKGISILFDIWNKFESLNKDWKLILIGDITFSDDIITKQRTLDFVSKHSESVVYIPETKDIQKYYRDSSVYLSTSRYEGLPLCLIEAITMGLPVVSFNITGNNEVVLNDINGILVPPYDETKYIDAMEKLVNDESLRMEYSHGSLEHAKSFNKDVIMSKWINLFESLIKK